MKLSSDTTPQGLQEMAREKSVRLLDLDEAILRLQERHMADLSRDSEYDSSAYYKSCRELEASRQAGVVALDQLKDLYLEVTQGQG